MTEEELAAVKGRSWEEYVYIPPLLSIPPTYLSTYLLPSFPPPSHLHLEIPQYQTPTMAHGERLLVSTLLHISLGFSNPKTHRKRIRRSYANAAHSIDH